MSGIGGDSGDRLRRSNPVTQEEAPGPDSPQAKALLDRVLRIPATPKPRQSRRRYLWVLAPAALIAVAAAGFGLLHNVSHPLDVVCFQGSSLDAHRAAVSLDGREPIAACGELWLSGAELNPAGRATPSLFACLLDNGAVGVFPSSPGTDSCAAIGLPTFTIDEEGTEHAAIVDAENNLTPSFLDRCVNESEAIALVGAELSRQGLSDWRVVTPTPFTTERSCATLAFDIPKRTIRLVPVPDRASN